MNTNSEEYEAKFWDHDGLEFKVGLFFSKDYEPTEVLAVRAAHRIAKEKDWVLASIDWIADDIRETILDNTNG